MRSRPANDSVVDYDSYRVFRKNKAFGTTFLLKAKEEHIKDVERKMFERGLWSDDDGLSEIREAARFFIRLHGQEPSPVLKTDDEAYFHVWLCEDPRHDEVLRHYFNIDHPEVGTSRMAYFRHMDDWVRHNPDTAFQALKRFYSKTDWSRGVVSPWEVYNLVRRVKRLFSRGRRG